MGCWSRNHSKDEQIVDAKASPLTKQKLAGSFNVASVLTMEVLDEAEVNSVIHPRQEDIQPTANITAAFLDKDNVSFDAFLLFSICAAKTSSGLVLRAFFLLLMTPRRFRVLDRYTALSKLLSPCNSVIWTLVSVAFSLTRGVPSSPPVVLPNTMPTFDSLTNHLPLIIPGRRMLPWETFAIGLLVWLEYSFLLAPLPSESHLLS